MFADSLLESAPHPGHRSAWTKLASLAIESLALAAALAIPLFHIERLEIIPPPPSIRLTSAAPPEVRPSNDRLSGSTASFQRYVIVQRPWTSGHVNQNADRDQGPSGPPLAGPVCISNCGGGGVSLTDLIKPGALTIPKPPPPARPLVVSEMKLGELVRKVVPQYPTIAKQVRVQGPVVLMAIIGKDGRVQQLKAISGHPMLVPAAIRAVEQWQYRPYLLNHEPVEVETHITVNFVLNSE